MNKRIMRLVIFLIVVLFIVMNGAKCLAADSSTDAVVGNALNYLKTQQQADGSWVNFDGAINATLGSTLAIAAAGQDPALWTSSGNSPFDYLISQAGLLSDEATVGMNAAKISQLILALVASGKDPHAFAGVDWIIMLNKAYEPSTSRYGTFFIHHPWAVLALKAAGESVPDTAIAYLRDSQESNGAFAFNGKGTGADTNATSLCVEALIAAGEPQSSDTVTKALAYLHTQQNEDGGFPWANPSDWGTDSDSCSTSWVVQALIAAGEDPTGDVWTKNGNDPYSFLTGMQNASGALGFMKSWSVDDLMSTYQGIPALCGQAFPIPYTQDPLPPPPPPEPPAPPATTPPPAAQPAQQPAGDSGAADNGEGSSANQAATGSNASVASSSSPVVASNTNAQNQNDNELSADDKENEEPARNKDVKKPEPEVPETSPFLRFIYLAGGFLAGSSAFFGTMIGIRYGWNRWLKED
jgi:hypothetical protein